MEKSYIYIYIYILWEGKKDATPFPDKPVSWIASLFRGLMKEYSCVPKVTLVLKVHEVPRSAHSHSLWHPVWNYHAETHAQMKLKAEYLSSLQSELREILKDFSMGCMIERDVWLQLTVEVDRAMGRSKGLLWKFPYLMIVCLPILFLFSLISSDWI